MKTNKYKYLTAITSFLVSIFMLFDWFVIKAVGTVESHSFITIPSMLTSGANFLTQLGGKAVAISILILGASLEYMCIASAALGIWGAIRTIIKPYKSRLITMSQIVSVALTSLALVAVILINVVSVSKLGGIVSVIPTFWFAADVIFLILSFVFSNKFPSQHELEAPKNSDEQ